MIELIQWFINFTFQSFVHWLGVTILTGVILFGVVDIIKAMFTKHIHHYHHNGEDEDV